MITNENKFLGLLIKCKNENDICNITEVIQKSEMSDVQCMSLIQSLCEKGMVKYIDLSNLQINPIAYSTYQSPQKKVGKSFLNLSVSFLKFIVTYVLGIISGLIIAYLTHKFGWQ